MPSTKVLCHRDMGPFCNYDPAGSRSYAMYFSDEETPPKPLSLNIVSTGLTDLKTLIWRPVVHIIGEPVEDVEIYGEYDDETGEPV